MKWTIAPHTPLQSILNAMHSCTLSYDTSIKQSEIWHFIFTALLRATAQGYTGVMLSNQSFTAYAS